MQWEFEKESSLEFQGRKEVHNDFNAFEHLSNLLANRINKRRKVDEAYEQLSKWKKHLKNVPRDLTLPDCMKLMRV